MADDPNVVPLPRRDTRFAEMEGEICDLVRIADLALHCWLSELEGPITDDGSVMQLILEGLQQQARKLRARYRDIVPMIALLALSWFALPAPAAAQSFDAQYNVDFTINGIDQVLGDIDVSCGNGCLISGWQFTVTGIADGEQGITSTISSAAGGTVNQAASPLVYTSTGVFISAEGGGFGGPLTFTGGNNNNGGGTLYIYTDEISFEGDDSGLGAGESFDNPNGSEVQIGTIDPPQPLPAPTLGEGLPGLAFAAALIWLWRRRALAAVS